MGKASCTYVSAFILALFAIIFILIAVFTSIDLISLSTTEEETTQHLTEAGTEKSVTMKILSIPNQKAYSAGCVFLLSCTLLVAIGFLFFL